MHNNPDPITAYAKATIPLPVAKAQAMTASPAAFAWVRRVLGLK